MTMKNDAKFGEELICCFKIDQFLQILTKSELEILKNVHFNDPFFTKVYHV